MKAAVPSHRALPGRAPCSAVLFAMSMCIPVFAPAQALPADRRPAAQLAAAEFAFAARSVASDMREAFLAVLADDAILLRCRAGRLWKNARRRPSS